MNNNILAIILKTFSVLSFVIMDVFIKKLSDYFPTNEIIFFRCLFGLLPVTFMLYLTKSSLKTSKINRLIRTNAAFKISTASTHYATAMSAPLMRVASSEEAADSDQQRSVVQSLSNLSSKKLKNSFFMATMGSKIYFFISETVMEN
jgi:hypothetical protein